jgi:hypothetical protein
MLHTEQLILLLSETQNNTKPPIASIITYSLAYLMDYGVNVLGSLMCSTAKKNAKEESDDQLSAEVLPHF